MNDSIWSAITSYSTAIVAGVLSMDGQDWLLYLSVALVVARLCIEIPKAIYGLRKFFNGEKPDGGK